MSLVAPTPVPTPTTPQSVLGAQTQAANASNGNTQWNQQWNQYYNQAWNAGYNNGGMPSADSSFNSALSQGYSAGQNASKSKQSSGGGSGVSNNTSSSTNNNGASNNQQSGGGDSYAQQKADIGSAWDNYIGSLNGMNSDLNTQQTAQTNIADTQWQAGQDTVNTQQAKSLRDISTNVKNAFQAGNNYLGARGAGDSSAASQYSYAVQQDAQKQIGQLNEFVSTQMSQLQSTHDTQINSIAQWFSQQQQAIKQAIASGELSKSQDINNLSKQILDQALQATNQIKTDTNNRYNALVQWAANNSTNLSQLQGNIAGIPKAMGTPTVDSTGNISQLPIGAGNYSGSTTNTGSANISNPLFSSMSLEDQNKLLGQPTWGQ